MGLLGKIGKCVDVFLEYEEPPTTKSKTADENNNENYDKGLLFEKYVIEMFNKKYFALHDWTRDLSGKTEGYTVESDANPDLVIRYKPKDEQIAIECKFRSSLYQGKLQWTTAKKLRGYHAYANNAEIPTFIVIGLGGHPDSPKRMFCIPLSDAKYPMLYPSIFEKFERNPSKKLFWNGTALV